MEEKLLLEKIHDLKKRLRFVWIVNGALQWCLPGALTTLVLVALLKLLDRPPVEMTAATLALVLFPLGGAVAAGMRKLPLMSVALATDRKLGLRERLTTGLEWSLSDRPRTVVAQSLLRDASKYAASVDPEKTFKPTVPTSLRRAAIVSLMTGLLLVLPPWHVFQPSQNAQEVRLVKQAAQRLERTARELRQKYPDSRQAKATAQKLEDLAQRLKEPGTERQEAAARVNSLAEQLRSQARGQGQGQQQGGPGMGTSADNPRNQADRLRSLARRAQKEGASKSVQDAVNRELARTQPNTPQAQALQKASQAAGQGNAEGTKEELEKAAAAAEQQAAEEQQMGEEVAQELQETESGLSQEMAQGNQPGGNGGKQPGQGQAVANKPGQPGKKGEGTKEGDFGQGTTDQQQKPGDGKKPNYLVERQAQDKSEWTEEYKRLYASERIHRDTADAKVKGQIRPGQMLPGSGQVRGAPRSQPGAGEGAEEVYLDYKREAEEAVTRQNVPAEYRDVVRDYFDGIDPRERK